MKGLARFWPVLLVILALILAGCAGGQAATPSDNSGTAGADATAAPAEASGSGDVVITKDSVDTPTQMKIGEKVVVKLDPEWTWTLDATPALVLPEVDGAQLQPDEQGLFEAKMNGSAVIQAIGMPKCAKDNPPCATPQAAMLFKVKVTP